MNENMKFKLYFHFIRKILFGGGAQEILASIAALNIWTSNQAIWNKRSENVPFKMVHYFTK